MMCINTYSLFKRVCVECSSCILSGCWGCNRDFPVRLQGTDTQSKKQSQDIVPILSPPQQVEVNAQEQEERQ